MCPSRRLGWRGRGFETGNSAAPPPGSSAGNTARPRTRGSTYKDKENKTGKGRETERESHKKHVTFTTFIFRTMYWLDEACHFLLHCLCQ